MLGNLSYWRDAFLRLSLALGCGVAAFGPAPAQAQAPLLIWPIDPVIEPGRTATAINIENKGTTLSVVQVRVFAWEQKDGDDNYVEQSQLIASPPIARIAPGERQMIRLSHIGSPSGKAEMAYRVLIDEVPTSDIEDDSGANDGADKLVGGVRFRMRFLLPLFIYSGSAGKQNAAANLENLSCQFVSEGSKKMVRLTNKGDVHTRLSDLRLALANTEAPVDGGQLVYLLPGASKSLILPDVFKGSGAISAAALGTAPRIRLPDCARA